MRANVGADNAVYSSGFRMSCFVRVALLVFAALVVPFRAYASADEPATPGPDLPNQVRTYVSKQMAERHIPGISVGVVRDGSVMLTGGYGLANVELGVAATPDTVYGVLSVGKQFTAAAIMQMAEAGTVHLDEPIATCLPGMPTAWQAVTVRHLLSHTSGIPDYTDTPGFAQTIRQDRSPLDVIRPVLSMALEFPPGEEWRYSNTGYYLLGMIVERVSGQPYAQYLTARIFQPVGMKATRVNDLNAVIPNRAAGYTWWNDQLSNAEYASPTQMWAAGGVVSTVRDLATWDAALSTDTLLQSSSREQMVAPAKLANGQTAPYGFGNELAADHGHRVAGHQGGGLAFDATLLRYVDDRLTVIVLSNLTGSGSRDLARHIASFYLPAISDAGNTGIADSDPQTTARVRQVLLDAAQGNADPAQFAPASRGQLVPFIKREGPLFLGPLGTLHDIVLLDRVEDGTTLVLRYRTRYDGGSIVWTVTVTADGEIVSLEPQEE